MTDAELAEVRALAADARFTPAQRATLGKLVAEHVAVEGRIARAVELLEKLADQAGARRRRVPPALKLRRIAADAAQGARAGREEPTP